MRKTVLTICVCTLVFLFAVPALAEGFEKGSKEVTFRFAYSDVDFGSAEGFNLGGTTNVELAAGFGWFLSKSNEIGVTIGYVKEEIDGGDLFESDDVDGSSFGVFYNYNFTSGSVVTPYLGVGAGVIGGDTGDLYSYQYGAEVGLKIYPFEHGGVIVGLGYNGLVAEEDWMPDGTALGLFAGFALRF